MTATSASSSASTTTGPKVSLFAAKSGFVIPKNKLSGSLVPIFKGGKKPGGNVAVNGESTNQVQRKTKWGPDLTQDADVRRGRALAYQTRVDQIVQQLKSEIPEPGGDQDAHEFNELEDLKSSSPPVHNKNTELLELEKQEAIGEILKLNPTYKVPLDYKPLLKEITVPIPVKEYPGYNFIGLIFGHGSETQKRLEKETGAKIQVHGTKAHTGEKVEISSSDGNETQVVYEELSVLVTASTFEKVDEAVVLIELLLSSVSGNLAAGDNATVSQNQEASTPFMVSTHVNQGVLPPVTPQQGQFQYQSSWFPAATPQALAHQPSGLIPPQTFSAPILNNPVHVQSSSFNSSTMPSLFGPRPVQAFSNPYQPRNFPMPAPQPQFTGSLSQPTGLSVARPLLLQPLSSGPTGPPPDRPLRPSGISSGWPGAPSSVPASLGFGNMGQTTPPMVPPPGPRHAVPQLGFPSPAAPPNAISMNRPTTAPTFTSIPQPQAGPSSVPTPIQSSLGMPLPNSSITPAFGSAPISSLMMPASQATLQSGVVGAFPVTTSNFAPIRSPTITNAKVQHSGTGDFTFRPHHQQNPSPQIVPSFSSHHAAQNGPLPRPRMQTQTPQAPHFHMDAPNSTTQPGRHLFPPHVGNQRGQAPFVGNPTGHSLHPRLPPFSNASPGGPPVMQMGSRNFSSTPHLPNLTGPLPPRPGNPMQLQQNYPAPIAPRGQSIALNQQPFISSASARPPSFQGGQQVYDPFSPTSVSVASQRQVGNLEKRRKSENDPEYEDLMDSVGVK
ncbi:RNA-BINDING KH DOMAIN-CONTAINING PROTEIN [Salix koriyanagi]|uniref:RNA-BINDING KH DOMAIN-CONTAINING PROTEIN n=1 Tax=Salix koriyanagi TaxID=2511006 RepID=A0A9Q0PUC7_9ROSI|nr:RNA-BINDING KH DOMAIN-CONTAINING PROTEIN [Salix koriyanagi]